MNKVLGVSLLAMMLALLLCAPALAQTTGIALEGKVYTFTGGEGTYPADGKTFIISADAVIVQEPGMPDRVLELVQTEGTEIAQDEPCSDVRQSAVDSAVICEGTASCESSEAITVYAQYSCADSETDEAWAKRFEPYAEYGLRCDPENRILLYQGQRVRSFTDSCSLDGGVCTIIEFTDSQGTVDLQTERDQTETVRRTDGSFSPEGLLTGIRVLTKEEAAERSVSEWTTQVSAASEGEMTLAEKRAFFAPYAPFGLSYDAAGDALYYQGQRVRRFLDIRQSNGEALDSGRFHAMKYHLRTNRTASPLLSGSLRYDKSHCRWISSAMAFHMETYGRFS